MKPWLLTFVIIIAGSPFNAPAVAVENGPFGFCTRAQVIAFMETGLAKDAIVDRCTKAPASRRVEKIPVPTKKPHRTVTKPAAKPVAEPTKSAALQAAIRTGKIADLNGLWSLQFHCGKLSQRTTGLTVRAGNFIGTIHGDKDSLRLTGSIAKNGAIKIDGTGTHLYSELTGSVTDWQMGKGEGKIAIGGELKCKGTWSMTRQKRG